MKSEIVLQATRPAFLVLTPACIFLGLSAAIAGQTLVSPMMAFLVLVGALCAHVSVNTLNEYYDFKSGLDLKTNKTKFSGGSGALPGHPHMAKAVLMIGLGSLVLTVLIGIAIVALRGFHILPVGIVGVLLIVTYTQWINRWPFLCLITPGLGFGILMVVGTDVALSGSYSQLPWLLSLVPFFLTNNLLLLNQYPDREADASVGRNTFPIAFGVTASNMVYAAFMTAAYLLILVLTVSGRIPRLSAIALAPMVLSLFSLGGAVKYSFNIADHPQFLATNVAAAILTPILLGMAIIVG
ncbi:MAG: prenyltransferase [Gammaproteobacteria bacterium]|nr:prenyltransferase [Gammaproteobacteria bacterium]